MDFEVARNRETGCLIVVVETPNDDGLMRRSAQTWDKVLGYDISVFGTKYNLNMNGSLGHKGYLEYVSDWQLPMRRTLLALA